MPEFVSTIVPCLLIAGMASLWWPVAWLTGLQPVVILLSLYGAGGALTRRLHDWGVRGVRPAIIILALLGLSFAAVVFDLGLATNFANVAGLVVGGSTLFAIALIGGVDATRGANPYGPVPPWTHPSHLAPSWSSSYAHYEKIRRRMQRHRRTTLLLVRSQEPSGTTLGGLPDLEREFTWPYDRCGKPQAFIAQLDLAQVRRNGGPLWLPEGGFLYFFHMKGGIDLPPHGWAVAYREDLPAGDLVTAPPGSTFPQRRMAMRKFPSYPSLEWLCIDLSEVDGDHLDELADYPQRAFAEYRRQHRIGGYPGEIQDGAMAVECELGLSGKTWSEAALADQVALTKAQAAAARKWRLLLQVDSDPALDMNWGDGGRLYFFVREKDAMAGDFTQTWAIFQSY
jgi:uncharacterized membrane protein YhaH (DUF805 family)